MEDQLTESEREQMRRFVAMQKIAGCILGKWAKLLVFCFLLSTAAFSVVFVWHFAYSGHRFSATNRLLYNPRKAQRIDNMSDKQLLSVLAHPQRTMGEKIHRHVPLGGEKDD